METKRLKLEIRNHLNTACRTRIIKSKQKIPKKKKKHKLHLKQALTSNLASKSKQKLLKKKNLINILLGMKVISVFFLFHQIILFVTS
jgi:hypothetical protein